MSEEDRIDEIIRNAASDYNRPSATPRDEMWMAIQAAQQSPGPRLHVTAGGAASGYRSERKFGPRYAWLGMAAAAVLLVATGVGIGRYTSGSSVAPSLTRQAPRQIADAPAALPTIPNDEPGGAQPAPVEHTGNNDVSETQNPPRTGKEIRKNPVIKGTRPLTPVGPSTMVAQNQGSGVYQVATLRHLADAEALLTTFALESKDQRMDRNFAGWAKGLLSNTRLLLDSPAGDDPRRAKLLQDLEMVLAQIVQLSPNAAATDRELIQGSIQNGQVITRLRTAIPAGEAREILER